MRRIRLLIFGVLGLQASALTAQAPVAPRTPLPGPDSAAMRPILEYMLTHLARHAMPAAFDTVQRPWRMRFPDSSAAWRAYEAHLRTVLRARAVTPQDTWIYEFQVRLMRLTRDTIWTHLSTIITERCPGGREALGSRESEAIYAVRLGDTWWSEARSTGRNIGDGRGCPRPR